MSESVEDKILFAQVIFDDERRKRIIRSVGDIKFNKSDESSIQPKNDQDFIQKHKYYVKYLFCSLDGINCSVHHEHDIQYCGAFINLLGCSHQEIKEKERKVTSRTRLPNKKYMSTSESDAVNEKQSTSHSKGKKSVSKGSSFKNSMVQKRSGKVIAQFQSKLSNFRDSDSAELETQSDEEAQKVKKDLRTNNNNSEQRSLLKSNQKGNGGSKTPQNISPSHQSSATTPSTHSPTMNPRNFNQDNEMISPGHSCPESPASSRNLNQGYQENECNISHEENNAEEENFEGYDDQIIPPVEVIVNEVEILPNDANNNTGHRAQENDANNNAGHRAEENYANNNAGHHAQENDANNDAGHHGQENADNESHRHNKKWIENFICQTLKYYKTGPGREDRRRRYQINENSKIYLGLGVMIDYTRWTVLLTEEDEAKFCKSLSQIIWNPYDLCNRAVEVLKIVDRNRIPGRSPVRELEKDRLRLLMSLTYDYLGKKQLEETQKIAVLKKVTFFLSKKIAELRTNAIKQAIRNARRRLFN